MIFIEINRKIEAKKALDQEYMFSVFQKRKRKFLLPEEKLIDLKIDLVRNFRFKFRNMSFKYELITNKRKKIVRAKISKYKDAPRREWQILNYLKKFNLGMNLPLPLDYFKPLNMFFYSEIPGISFEELLRQKKIVNHLEFAGLIAKWLGRVQSISQKPKFLPVKDSRQQLLERRHWFFLVRKCAPAFYPLFSQLLKRLGQIKQKNKRFFLFPNQFSVVHGDFHWGNVIKIKNQSRQGGTKIKNNFKVIDFGDAFLGDPSEDVGGFLAQNDSMFRYYAPDFIEESRKIREIFLKNYFDFSESPVFLRKDRESRTSVEIRLLYFEIQKILEMAAILGFIESNEKSKAMGMERLLTKAEGKMRELKVS